MKLSKSFIPLALSFDAAKLAEEAMALPDSAWRPHPGGLAGNWAVPLVSVGGEDNDLFHGNMATTPHLAKCPYHQQVLGSFNEILGRSRLMKIDPGAEVSPHVDDDYHWMSRVRIHIPVVTNPDVIFYCADDQLHMKEGDCWIFDSWKGHRVTNDSAHARIHLVMDLSGSSRFWKMVRKMEKYDHETDLEGLGRKIKLVPYQEGWKAKVATESFNVFPIMAPGEVDAIVMDLVMDFEGNPENDPAIAKRYAQNLQDFAKDWRQIWSATGNSEKGVAYYQTLLADIKGKLKAQYKFSVKLKSNGLDANHAITKRLLLPALDLKLLEKTK